MNPFGDLDCQRVDECERSAESEMLEALQTLEDVRKEFSVRHEADEEMPEILSHLEAHFLDGVAIAEIARTTGRSRERVSRVLRECKSLLRRKLGA